MEKIVPSMDITKFPKPTVYLDQESYLEDISKSVAIIACANQIMEWLKENEN